MAYDPKKSPPAAALKGPAGGGATRRMPSPFPYGERPCRRSSEKSPESRLFKGLRPGKVPSALSAGAGPLADRSRARIPYFQRVAAEFPGDATSFIIQYASVINGTLNRLPMLGMRSAHVPSVAAAGMRYGFALRSRQERAVCVYAETFAHNVFARTLGLLT